MFCLSFHRNNGNIYIHVNNDNVCIIKLNKVINSTQITRRDGRRRQFD